LRATGGDGPGFVMPMIGALQTTRHGCKIEGREGNDCRRARPAPAPHVGPALSSSA
jgi:hypothetical protein